MAGCHTPAIAGPRIAAALAATRGAPTAEVAPDPPEQMVLEEIQQALQALAA